MSLVLVLAFAPGAAGIEPQPVLDGLAFPTNMAMLPDGAFVFTEKETGSVRVVTPEGELIDRPLTTVAVSPGAERGLLGIAVHPDFEREPWIYLYLSDPADGLNRLVRVRVRTDGAATAGEPETLLVGLSAAAGYHNGGDMVFARDGTMFVALGEAHEPERAQDRDDIGGKLLRLEADGDVPPDNPFGPGNPAWSIGHRNSFGLCVDPATGELWETENGPDVDDEVNLIEEGANYGWPVVTGRAGDERFIDPVAVFPSPIALTGCAVVDGDVWFGSFDGRLWRLADGEGSPRPVVRFPAGVTDVMLGPDRLLLVATADAIWTVDPSTEQDTSSPREDPDAPWPLAVTIALLAVLGVALVVRLAAGRRLHPGGRAGPVP